MSNYAVYHLTVPIALDESSNRLQLGDGQGNYTHVGRVTSISEAGLTATPETSDVFQYFDYGGRSQPWRIVYRAAPTRYESWDVPGIVQRCETWDEGGGLLQIAFTGGPRLTEVRDYA